jgi:SAM-dependent methyltransferase
MMPPKIDEMDFELRDAIAAGLFDQATGDLYPGFPVTADDTVLVADYSAGNEANFCASRGAHVIHVADNAEASAAMADRLTNAGAGELTALLRQGGRLPVADGVATKIVTTDLIAHANDSEALLRELVRAGAPGALYLLVEPDPTAAEFQISLSLETASAARPVSLVGRREFDRIVTGAGLEIEERGSFGFYQAMRAILSPIRETDTQNGTVLDHWTKTWQLLLDMPNSGPVRHALHEVLPNRQYLIARKASGRKGLGLGNTLQMIRTILAGAPGAGAVDAKARRAKPAAGQNAPAEIGPVPVEDTLDPKAVGFHDAAISGWFKLELNGELFPGFGVGPDDVLLDVGCGQGAYSAVCGRTGAHIISVDIDAENVAETGRHVAETAARAFTPIVGDANPLPLEDNSVTKVISTEVIEHVDDPAVFLRELVRVGRPGARYLLAVPDALQEGIQRQVAPPEFFMKPKPGEGSIRGLSSGHLRTIGRDEFERMVTAAGLVVESVRLTSFYWALWFAFFWICNVDFNDPRHPLLTQWARTWKTVLDAPDGRKVKARLDNFMPKSQIIVARKP